MPYTPLKMKPETRKTFAGIYIVVDTEAFWNASPDSFKRLGLVEGRAIHKAIYLKEGFRARAVDEWIALQKRLGIRYAGEETVNEIEAAKAEGRAVNKSIA